MRAWRYAEKTCDKFDIWMDEDGVEHQGFLHDTGIDVLIDGVWVPQYQYPDGSVYPEI